MFSVVQMEAVPEEHRGIVKGVTVLAAGLGFGSMSMLGGHLIPLIGFSSLHFIGAASCVLSATIFWSYFRNSRESSNIKTV